MDNLKVRHAATVSTLNLEIDHLQITMASDRRQTKKLKAALDDLLKDISRETYGRRREISLRLALLLREATVAEGLQRWSRKARELFYHSAKGKGGTQATFEKCVEGAEALLQTLNSDISVEVDAHGSVARILAAQDAVATLVQELHAETGKRLELERQRGQGFFNTPLVPAISAAPLPLDNKVGPLTQPELVPITGSEPLKPSNVSPIGRASPPSQIIAGLMPNGPPNTTAISATASHAPSLSLLGEIFVVDDPKATPDPEGEETVPDPQTFTEPIPGEAKNIGGLQTNIVISSVDVVHQPAPRSLQEASFVHADSTARARPHPYSPSQSPHPPLGVNGSGELSTVALPTSLAAATTPPPPSTKSPLLFELSQVGHRYDDLQRAFRDCHLTLKDLKNNISSIAPITETVAILRAATQHLDDFNEDARVELEIRITDEELTTRGYQTLLNVPGAVSNYADHLELENHIRAFVGGTEKTVAKTIDQLRRKLDDLQHDLALVKRYLHELPDLELRRPPTPQTPTGWSSWTNILSGSPRTASPAPPTFGTVMTSARLRQSSSFTESHIPNSKSSSADSSPASRPQLDLITGLDLRIPMPSHVTAPSSYLRVDHGPSPSRSSPRPRTLSAMYMLGLGSSTLAINSAQSVNSLPSKSAASIRWSDKVEEPLTDAETETDADDELRTDVE
jgi:hypothetical protein